MSYDYRVSIIVPVYNVEKYVADCLDSLLEQTMPHEDMEIIIVNDGSTDKSYEICKDYAEHYSCIKLFSKENEGLSATRNYGIMRAKGKYLMYIDSDDMFTSDTVLSVADYFDTVYDEVDLVTYFEQPYRNEDFSLSPHFRYKYFLNENGVYDLEEQPYILQTRVNVAVKNLYEKNELFDTTPGFKQEDQEYNNRILRDKLKIGYCADGCYLYNKGNEGSIVATSFHAYYLFEKSMAYFEKLFAQFDETVPKYYQAMFVHDLIWKLKLNILYPFHYEGEKFEHAIGRIKALLCRVDNKIIYEYPVTTNFIKQYWLSMKPNSNVTVYTDGMTTGVLSNGRYCYRRDKIEVVVVKVQVRDDKKLLIRAYVKSPLYNHISEKAEVFICENDNMEDLIQLDTYLSKYSYEGTNVQISNFYACEYVCDPNVVRSFSHLVKLDGFLIPAYYSFSATAIFSHSDVRYTYVRANTKITFEDHKFVLEKLTNEEAYIFEKERTKENYKDRLIVKDLRLRSIEYRRKHRVWLYSDLYTVKKDNGYYQFLNDFKHQDGVERYYVYTREFQEIEDLFTPEQRAFLVPFGSEKHKKLYLAAELILSGFYGRAPISPFQYESEELKNYADLEHFKVIYLQHGVLHASLYVQNSVENARADKIVISSPFEKKNYVKKYNYKPEDLIETSMARYDHINRNKKARNKILFAPSWRNYLATNVTTAKWDVQRGKIISSDYYKNIQKFIESKELALLLEKYDMGLELKLHPIISSAKDLFNIKSERISYASDEVDIADYRIFMTDFSSFVFDFLPLIRPVLYFVPDYPQFKSGMNHYRDLDLPFSEAFGPLALSSEEAIRNLEVVLENKCEPEKIYRQRMESFFYSLDNCAERLYQYIQESKFLC